MGSVSLNVLNGVTFGALLFLVAAGLSFTFGIMGVLNLAHGALYMVGAYVGWTLAVYHGINFFLAVLAAGAVVVGVGVAMELGVLRNLHGAFNEQTLVTFG